MEDPSNKSRFGLTVCSWVSVKYFRRPTVLFSVYDRDEELWQVTLGILPLGLILKRRGSGFISIPYVLLYLPLEINYFCLSLSYNTLQLFHNGGAVHSSSYSGEVLTNKNLTIFIGGGEQLPVTIPKTLGSSVNSKLSNNNANSSAKGAFIGIITDPKLWGAALRKKEITSLYMCKNINGTLPTYMLSMNGENISSVKINMSDSCLEKNFDFLFLPEGTLSFKENNDACQKLSLKLLEPNENENSQFNINAKKYLDNCRKDKWVAWIRSEINATGREDFEMSEMCDSLTELGLERIPCQENLCPVCQFENKRKTFILRGICSIDKVDLSFVLNKYEDKAGFYFHGIELFGIHKESPSSWVLKYETNGTIVASIKSSNLPIGIKEWTIEEDFCEIPKNTSLTASLSSCSSLEAVCGDGQCIPLSKRCNSYADCPDTSDELNCTTISSSTFYDPMSPPYPQTEIEINIDVIRVLSTPPEKPFTLIFETNYQWSDSRLNLTNLNPKLNYRLRNSNLWKPRLSLIALGNPSSSKIVSEKLTLGKTVDMTDSERSTIIASTFSNALPEKRDKPLIDAVYPGENVTLSVNVLAKQEVECEFDFTFFPFDEQLCQMSLVISSWPSYRLSLKDPVNGRYVGPVKLPHYTIVNTKAVRRTIKIDGKMHDGLVMIFHLKHRNSSLVISVYLPTFFLLILNCSTLWMVGHHGKLARMQISGIILISIMIDWILMVNYTPQTGYLMAVDAWICFSAVYSILHVAVHILLDIFIEEHHLDPFSRIPSRLSSSRVRDVKPADANSLYDGMMFKISQMEAAKLWSVPYWILFISRVVSPVLLLFFNCAYWPFVLYFSKVEML
ncbi:UNVERIFIED_CONTAM: hypothetical protein RMT77_019142 [Armadillidium vulgare]